MVQLMKKNTRINNPFLRQKAEDLAKKMRKDDFVATEGWFQRRKKDTISFIKAYGEQRKQILVRHKRGLKRIGPNR